MCVPGAEFLHVPLLIGHNTCEKWRRQNKEKTRSAAHNRSAKASCRLCDSFLNTHTHTCIHTYTAAAFPPLICASIHHRRSPIRSATGVICGGARGCGAGGGVAWPLSSSCACSCAGRCCCCWCGAASRWRSRISAGAEIGIGWDGRSVWRGATLTKGHRQTHPPSSSCASSGLSSIRVGGRRSIPPFACLVVMRVSPRQSVGPERAS